MAEKKYKVRNPYKPLKFAQGFVRAAEACSSWRMVVARSSSSAGSWWSERRSNGSFFTHEGEAPMQCGVVCDDDWHPVRIETRSGRQLPVLGEGWEMDEEE